jgi:hypothetical protein
VVVDRPATDLQDLGGTVDGNSFHDSHIFGKVATPPRDARAVDGTRGYPLELSHEIQQFL